MKVVKVVKYVDKMYFVFIPYLATDAYLEAILENR